MTDQRSAANGLSLALARLREGTEILRTGGGTTLTADQCRLLLDEIERLEADNAIAWRQVADDAGV